MLLSATGFISEGTCAHVGLESEYGFVFCAATEEVDITFPQKARRSEVQGPYADDH